MAAAKISLALALSPSISTTSGNAPRAGPVGAVIKVFLFAAAAGGDDAALGEELVGDFDAGGEQAARVAAEVEDQAPHALAVQVPQGGVEVAAGGLLERRDANVRHAGFRVDDLHIFQARHVDVIATDHELAGRLAGRYHRHADQAAFRAREQRGGLVGRQARRRPPIDGDDAIAVRDAGLLGGAAGMTCTMSSAPLSAFSSTPRPTKLPSICE